MEKSVFYEPHPEVFHNSKWQICMVKHGYYGVDDEYVSDESADAELTEKDIQLFELIDSKNLSSLPSSTQSSQVNHQSR